MIKKSVAVVLISIFFTCSAYAQLTKKQLLGTWYYDSMMDKNGLAWKADDSMYAANYAINMARDEAIRHRHEVKRTSEWTIDDSLRILKHTLAVHKDMVKLYFKFKRKGQYECFRFMHIYKVDTVGMEYGSYRIEGSKLVMKPETGAETKQECYRVNDALFIKTEEGVTLILKQK